MYSYSEKENNNTSEDMASKEALTPDDTIVTSKIHEKETALVYIEVADSNIPVTSSANATTRGKGNARRRIVVATIVVVLLMIITAVISAVLLFRSGKSPPSVTIPTASSTPTSGPVSRLDIFRSVLLNHFVSSSIDQPGTPQYQALNWLANGDGFMLNTSASGRFHNRALCVGTLVLYENGGINWVNQCNFLSNRSICEWNDKNGTGAFFSRTN